MSRPGIEPGPAVWQSSMLPPGPQQWTIKSKYTTHSVISYHTYYPSIILPNYPIHYHHCFSLRTLGLKLTYYAICYIKRSATHLLPVSVLSVAHSLWDIIHFIISKHHSHTHQFLCTNRTNPLWLYVTYLQSKVTPNYQLAITDFTDYTTHFFLRKIASKIQVRLILEINVKMSSVWFKIPTSLKNCHIFDVAGNLSLSGNIGLN